jgi:hypothetical protein
MRILKTDIGLTEFPFYRCGVADAQDVRPVINVVPADTHKDPRAV